MCCRCLGLWRVGGSAAPACSRNVSLPAPGVYYDTRAKDYYTIMRWDWTNDNYIEDGISNDCCTDIKIGGVDSQALRLNTSVVLRPNENAIQTQWGDSHYRASNGTTLCSNSSYGAAVCRQELAVNEGPPYDDLNQKHGQLVLEFLKTSDGHCHNVQAFAHYAHTWSSTSISSVGIGAYEVSFGWTQNNNRWVQVSQAGAYARVCG